MSFQAYLDAIEKKTGRTPQELIDEAEQKGFDDPDMKVAPILDWLKSDYGLGRGHGMALIHVIRNGPEISDKHVGSDGSHRDESTTLRLDGKGRLEGQAQTLDHQFVSPWLAREVETVRMAHVNADWPALPGGGTASSRLSWIAPHG